MPGDNRTLMLGYLAFVISPLFFSTNVVFGRAATDIAPFLLAFIRWSTTAAILLIICRNQIPAMTKIAREQWRLLALLGFLGMFICGGIVYLALHSTTATNGTLIYTIPPVIIVLIERIWRGRILRWRESLGILLAVLGVVVIVAKGSFATLLALEFNPGDLLFVLAAASWALYSVLLKSDVFATLSTLPLFALTATSGAIVLLPFAIWEIIIGIQAGGTGLPQTQSHLITICGIIILASLIAFSTFQYAIRVLGASIAGISLYLLPPYGITFAWLFLGETIVGFHIAGIILVLTGVILATFPKTLSQKTNASKK